MRCFIVYIFLSFFILIGCSKSEYFNDLPIQPTGISPGLNVETSYLKNQTIFFNMVDTDGNNINSITNFTVDNQLISGNTISYDNFGNHEVYAEYKSILKFITQS